MAIGVSKGGGTYRQRRTRREVAYELGYRVKAGRLVWFGELQLADGRRHTLKGGLLPVPQDGMLADAAGQALAAEVEALDLGTL